MKIENVVEITKSGIAQALGADYAEKIGTLSPTNSGALTDLGTKVTSASGIWSIRCPSKRAFRTLPS